MIFANARSKLPLLIVLSINCNQTLYISIHEKHPYLYREEKKIVRKTTNERARSYTSTQTPRFLDLKTNSNKGILTAKELAT